MDKQLVEQKTREFFKVAGEPETIWNVVDVLKEEHQLCFDLALEMQNRNLVKLLYSLYPTKVMVETTLLARDVALKM